MSHFAVMVIGPNVKTQLAPYHEFECTGENDKYVVDEDVTDEITALMCGDTDPLTLEDALSYHGLEDKIVDDESKVDTEGDECAHKFGYAIVKDGQLIKAARRTNPNSKWDWYQVGGRWSGFLKLKEGATGEHGERSWMSAGSKNDAGTCDSALKGAIDFDGMRNQAGEEAAQSWDKAHEIINDRAFITWEQAKAQNTENGSTNYDKARDLFQSQAVIQDFDRRFGPFQVIDKFMVTRENFIQQARDAAISTYAFVKDGVWCEKGEMGWFGMSDDKVSQEEWNKQLAAMLDSLPDDTQITIVDCHI